MKESYMKRFIDSVNKLSAIQFLGIVKILCIKYDDENGDLRPFDELWPAVLNGYQKLGREQRKDLLRTVEKAVS